MPTKLTPLITLLSAALLISTGAGATTTHKNTAKKTPAQASATAKKKPAGKPAVAPKPAATAKPIPKPRSGAEILAQSPDSHWRGLDPENTLLMELPQGQTKGQVLIELAPRFAPLHTLNIRALAHGGYYDGLAVVRVQDNFVTQWGDPNADDTALAKPLGAAAPKLPAEFSIPLKDLPLARLPDLDGWAPVTGFVDGFSVAADPKTGRAWLAHCYGAVGAGRSDAVDSSTGAELYAVIGQAPRGLDLNITLVGRVLKGIELLASLQRGGPNMGFYEQAEQRQPIQRVRLLADMPLEDRPALQVLRTDSNTWTELLASRRNRGGWFVHNPNHVDLCGITPPTRPAPTTKQ
ncbi:peptidylprolyl isomerase [Roseateles oligotrophus]|uniref:peptidylprolyl isomerase n=1 Tax=Roseateles oligotrophus TaxID=1769250 RepID=A0ABT2YHD1_9BURK|nr:peptidylprolyl isomerase [Roseateles oligotrophus]MCV2369457.1 peptidylprolyl isomerase [Roseateles oligotrophus]